jgi:hypothetical protein
LRATVRNLRRHGIGCGDVLQSPQDRVFIGAIAN